MDRFTSMKIFTRIIQLDSFTIVVNEIGLTQSAVSKNMTPYWKHVNHRRL